MILNFYPTHGQFFNIIYKGDTVKIAGPTVAEFDTKVLVMDEKGFKIDDWFVDVPTAKLVKMWLREKM